MLLSGAKLAALMSLFVASASRAQVPRDTVLVALVAETPRHCEIACVFVGHARVSDAIVLDERTADSAWALAAVFWYLLAADLRGQGAGRPATQYQVGLLRDPRVMGDREAGLAGELLRRLRSEPLRMHPRLGWARLTLVLLPRGVFRARPG